MECDQILPFGVVSKPISTADFYNYLSNFELKKKIHFDNEKSVQKGKITNQI